MTAPKAVAGAALLAPFAALILAPTPAVGQAAGGADGAATVRVIEVVDPATGESLRSPVAHLGPTEVRAIQEALVRAGELGTATGRLDAPTREALRRFQADRGLAPCACPSYETLLALGLEPRVVEIIVRAPGDVPASRTAAAAATAGVQVVYGTPPRPPAPAGGTEAERRAPKGDRGEPGRDPAEATPWRGDDRFLLDDRGFFFPVLVDSPFSPFFDRRMKRPSAEPAQRGSPLGRRPPPTPPVGIGTRAPPR